MSYVDVYLFDASSLLNLIKRGVVRQLLLHGSILDLTVYESMNAVWKEHLLLKRIDREVAERLACVINSISHIMGRLSITGYERAVLDTAIEEGITVYDASYICMAREKGLTLVTDDHELGNKASKYVRVMSSKDFSS